MVVELLHHTPLEICMRAIRTCWDSFNKSDNCGANDLELIQRVGNKNNHKSVLEHLVYSFSIKDISRACLQELARHRMASLSVKSTRYTLKELRREASFLPIDPERKTRASSYIILKGDDMVDEANMHALENLRLVLDKGIANDIAKYCLPECYKTQLIYTVNARSLQNFLHLRTSQSALKEIQTLAFTLYDKLPDTHKYLFKEYLQHS